ncbi:hypothetical protein GPECTOR_27g658 [Gonium pectorale]|uniref:SCP domain-containing protein n=1 Tax=Gonium pectorale TaxID=33097 RepID=A0A150GF92_GONPE|nr:hypothetical protein GPECTOR_27g658 [Gonium pectorale]|eukprot:KXZ48488.1 hypothetical protein GPECTOR_27g658 [Gonium pectorale]
MPGTRAFELPVASGAGYVFCNRGDLRCRGELASSAVPATRFVLTADSQVQVFEAALCLNVWNDWGDRARTTVNLYYCNEMLGNSIWALNNTDSLTVSGFNNQTAITLFSRNMDGLSNGYIYWVGAGTATNLSYLPACPAAAAASSSGGGVGDVINGGGGGGRSCLWSPAVCSPGLMWLNGACVAFASHNGCASQPDGTPCLSYGGRGGRCRSGACAMPRTQPFTLTTAVDVPSGGEGYVECGNIPFLPFICIGTNIRSEATTFVLTPDSQLQVPSSRRCLDFVSGQLRLADGCPQPALGASSVFAVSGTSYTSASNVTLRANASDGSGWCLSWSGIGFMPSFVRAPSGYGASSGSGTVSCMWRPAICETGLALVDGILCAAGECQAGACALAGTRPFQLQMDAFGDSSGGLVVVACNATTRSCASVSSSASNVLQQQQQQLVRPATAFVYTPDRQIQVVVRSDGGGSSLLCLNVNASRTPTVLDLSDCRRMATAPSSSTSSTSSMSSSSGGSDAWRINPGDPASSARLYPSLAPMVLSNDLGRVRWGDASGVYWRGNLAPLAYDADCIVPAGSDYGGYYYYYDYVDDNNSDGSGGGVSAPLCSWRLPGLCEEQPGRVWHDGACVVLAETSGCASQPSGTPCLSRGGRPGQCQAGACALAGTRPFQLSVPIGLPSGGRRGYIACDEWTRLCSGSADPTYGVTLVLTPDGHIQMAETELCFNIYAYGSPWSVNLNGCESVDSNKVWELRDGGEVTAAAAGNVGGGVGAAAGGVVTVFSAFNGGGVLAWTGEGGPLAYRLLAAGGSNGSSSGSGGCAGGSGGTAGDAGSCLWRSAGICGPVGKAWSNGRCVDTSADAVIACTNAVRENPDLLRDAPCFGSVEAEIKNPPRKPLQVNAALTRAASDHNSLMILNQNYSHWFPGELRLQYRVLAAGYPRAAVAENVAKGFTSARDVVTFWLCSPDHRWNMFDCSFKDIGVASGSLYYTQVIACTNAVRENPDLLRDAPCFGSVEAEIKNPPRKPLKVNAALTRAATDHNNLMIFNKKLAHAEIKNPPRKPLKVNAALTRAATDHNNLMIFNKKLAHV